MEQKIKDLSVPDPSIYCPLLYASSDSSCDDKEAVSPQEIKTVEIDSTDDLTDGILAVDGAHVRLNKVM